MRRIPQYNFREFDIAKQILEEQGHTVISPADIDRASGFDPFKITWPPDWKWENPPQIKLREVIARDLDAINACDSIFLLRGWETSTGARTEKAYAEWLGLNVMYQNGAATNEDRKFHVDASGGRKEVKEAAYALIPAEPLEQLAILYGRGAKKYDAHNWRRGYPWGLSFSACMRHLWKFWRGEDMDEETGVPHVINAAFHCFAMCEFMQHNKDKDDRYRQPDKQPANG